MEAIATGMAVDVAKAMTKVVAARAFEEMRLVWGFKDQLERLKKKFNYIQALLNDLGKGKHAEKSQLVNVWLKDVKEVAYSAENLLDDHAYEMLRRKIELKTNRPSFKKKCGYYMRPSTSPIVFRIRMTSRVKRILSELDKLFEDARNIGLQPAKPAEKASTSAGRTDDGDALYQARKHAGARGSDFIGRDQDMEKLLQLLLNPTTGEADLTILAIVGIGGLGKTTLARQLFEHGEVDGKFTEKKVWICVSEDFRINKILKEMVESLASNKKCESTNTCAIIKQLEEELKGKKFFLVLDDVWNENKELWDSLKNELQGIGGITGSVILITTRSHAVASRARASHSHKLKGLLEEAGWDLLKQQVFDETMPYDPSFDDVGRRIVVEKCKGVPLAIKSIGGLLQSKQHRSDWESIENSKEWNVKEDDTNYIMPSLLLSYNHMDHVYAKQCFAYCAIFPKDSVMEKDQLISLWLAEGLLHNEIETNNLSATLEINGENCINILVNHSFLQEENEDHEIRYTMHDLVHDLATYVSKNDLLVWKAEDKLEEHVDISQLRHLALNFDNNNKVLNTFLEEKMKKLRTIIFWDEIPRWKSLICSRYLRILVMVKVGVTEISSVIGQLVHLRYLDLSENDIKALPNSVCKLYQLQTLRLLQCKELKELPEELHRLSNIRHIKTSSPVFVPSGLGLLTSLQTLPCLKLRDREGWTIEELGPLNQAKGDVYIKGLEHVKNKEKAREVEIWRKEKILKLKLFWGSDSEGNDDEDVLDSLEPHPNIQSLHIKGFKGGRFPLWITTSVKQRGHPTQLSHLKEVKLKDCKRCERVPSLGQLPHLTILKLYGFDEVECIGEEFYEMRRNNMSDVATEVPVVGAGERKPLFLALREFHIENFKKLATWMPPTSAQATTAFPRLETLEIEDCGRLEMVPALHYESLKHLKLKNLGGIQPLDIIKGIHGLSSLEVLGMKGMVSLPKELSNYRNLQELVIENCMKVKCIPSGMISLKKLIVKSCPSLASIEDGVLQGLSSLRQLEIGDCIWLQRMPKNLEDCTSLEFLYIVNCPLIVEDPIPNIGKLQGLTVLRSFDAGRLTAALPQWIPQLHRLCRLDFGGWGEEWDMSLTSTLTSLRQLNLSNCPTLKPLPAEQPLEHLTSLYNLRFYHIWEMEELPEWIGYLSSLRFLLLWDCKKLKYLPSEQAISSLSQLRKLRIMNCPLLGERCDKDNGPEWPKISHIPDIVIA